MIMWGRRAWDDEVDHAHHGRQLCDDSRGAFIVRMGGKRPRCQACLALVPAEQAISDAAEAEREARWARVMAL